MNHDQHYAILDKVELDKETAKEGLERALTKLGWKHTCQTPGSFWLWTKRITITRRNRNPAYIKREGGGYVPNPNADGWTEETTTYDALCSAETAFSIEKALACEGVHP
jgi:hypothetical protein